jgi:hypothetical protein
MKNLVYNFWSSSIINFFDSFVDYRKIPNGFIFLNRVIDLDLCDDLRIYLQGKLNINNFEDPDILLHAPNLFQVIEHPCVKKIILNYIGKRACLDYACFSRISGMFSESHSGLWHHDSVGSRLKLFLIVSDYIGSDYIHTEYIPRSHNQRRLSYSNPVRLDGSRIKTDDLKQKKFAKKFLGRKGDIVIFDTNGLHRGVYEHLAKTRDTIQFEFSDLLKSCFLKGQVGPRSSKFHMSLCDSSWLSKIHLKLFESHGSY